MITAYTGRAAPITCGVQRVRQEIRASQPDPQRSTIAELFAPRFLCERGRLTRFRTGRVFQRRVDRRSRFNKIRSIDLEPVSHRWRLYRIALWRFESVFRGTWTCSWAFSLVWSVVPDPCGFLPRTYRPRWSVFPLFIGQGLRRKYRRRPLGGIMKFQTPIDGREWAREKEAWVRGLQDINGFRSYINWVGLVVHRVSFFFFSCSECFEVWFRIIFDLCFNIFNLLCRKFSMNFIGMEIHIYFIFQIKFTIINFRK